MAEAEAKQRIIQFLEQQLFLPVLDSNPAQYPQFRKADAEEAQRRVAAERAEIVGADSAGAVVLAFHQALKRSAKSQLEELLQRLDLPTFASVRDELDNLAAEFAVAPQRERSGQIS
jgi:hypothetical protein